MPPRRFLTTCTTALPETGGTRGDEPGRLHQGQHRQTSRGGPRAPPPRNLNQPGIAAENRPSEGRRRAASAESDDVGLGRSGDLTPHLFPLRAPHVFLKRHDSAPVSMMWSLNGAGRAARSWLYVCARWLWSALGGHTLHDIGTRVDTPDEAEKSHHPSDSMTTPGQTSSFLLADVVYKNKSRV